MDRNVRRTAVRGLDGSITAENEPPPPEKLLKFFPAEALALYTALDPIALELGNSDAGTLKFCLWASLVISVLLCVVILKKLWSVEAPVQYVISAGALVLYVAALGGPFATIDGYKPLMGMAAAIIATAFLFLVKAPAPPAD